MLKTEAWTTFPLGKSVARSFRKISTSTVLEFLKIDNASPLDLGADAGLEEAAVGF